MSYTRLESLESTGTQYIDTGINATSNLTTKVTVLSKVWDGTVNTNLVFGVYTGNSTPNYWLSMNYNRGIDEEGAVPTPKIGGYAYGTSDTKYLDNAKSSLNTKYDFVWDKNILMRNGVQIAAPALQDFSTDDNIFLFARKGVNDVWPSSKVIYKFSIEEDGVSKLNFIPALDSSGIPGMYDTVSKTFKTNVGTGQFAIGMTLDQVISLKLPVAPAAPNNKLTLSVPGEVMYRYDAQKVLNAVMANGWELTIQYREIETPEFQGYVVAEYIEKPVDSYAYINTGLSQRLVGYFDYMNTECAQNTDYSRIWGMWSMQSAGRGSLWVQKTDSNIWLYELREVNCEINTRHDLVHVLCARRLGDSSSNTYVGLGVDGSWPAYAADWPIPDELTEPYRMFAQRSAERLYSARFTDIEHKDIASFIPAIDPDGNPCMFDFVRKQPFYNANGTNKFAFTIGLTQEQAESLVLGDKGSGLTVQVPEGTDLEVMQANNPNVTIIIQTIPATTN